MEITAASLSLFLALANDAGNWSGNPLFGAKGNVGDQKRDQGNLTQLKQAGLLTTDYDDEEGLVWVHFTKSGAQLAATHGIDLAKWGGWAD